MKRFGKITQNKETALGYQYVKEMDYNKYHVDCQLFSGDSKR